jgi:hypothetical protein
MDAATQRIRRPSLGVHQWPNTVHLVIRSGQVPPIRENIHNFRIGNSKYMAHVSPKLHFSYICNFIFVCKYVQLSNTLLLKPGIYSLLCLIICSPIFRFICLDFIRGSVISFRMRKRPVTKLSWERYSRETDS